MRFFQNLKILLLKKTPIKNNSRKIYVSKTKLSMTSIAKEISFDELQKTLFKFYILIYFDDNKIL